MSAWIKWEGGPMPVVPYTMIEVKYRNFNTKVGCFDHQYKWDHRGDGDDIIAYRVIEGESDVRINIHKPEVRVIPSEIAEHPLFDVLIDAIKQATKGKGQRHGGDVTPFLEQQWVALAKSHGVGFLTGQASKKLNEAAVKTLAGAYETEPFEREVLGAIVYAGMAVLNARGRA